MSLNLVAPVNQLGYGVVGYNVLKSLTEADSQVSYFPIGRPEWESDLSFVKKCIDNSKTFDSAAPSIRIWHQHDLAMFPGGGERIGWPIFELDSFTDIEVNHLKSVDRLFVCSQWAKDVIVERGCAAEDEVEVIPLGVDSSTFFVDEEERARRPYWTRDKTVFINVGKWEVRKGHNELLEAFCSAFTPEDNVELWMLNDNPFIGLGNEEWKTKYISSEMGANIKLLPRANTQAELRAKFNQVDFGVFPSHAEGWNLEPLELMACGVPSIVTNYSGHTEYCNASNSLLVEPNGMSPANDDRWFHGQGEWCTFDTKELVKQMRLAHKMKQKIVTGGKSKKYEKLSAESLKTAKAFSWENTACKIKEALS